MEIKITLEKDFEEQLEHLKEKYGDEITRVNGFAKEQLDYTQFISNFIDSDNVANATIDPNANQSTKDVRSLLDEMSKSHQKLLSMNKIYYEMKKKYGKEKADKWLEDEFSGALYLHDASSASFYSYCFTGDTKIITNEGVKELKSLVGKNIMVLNKHHEWENATVKNFGKQHIRKLVLERKSDTKEIYVTGNHRWFVEEKNGTLVYETDELEPGMNIPYNTPNPLDSKSSSWVVKSIENTNRCEEVYCAVTEYSGSFTLDGNVLTHNCYAYELQNLAEKGLYFLPKSNTSPPRHLTTFMAHLREFIVWVSNRTSGACALPSFFVYTYYFWKKDVENGYFLKDPEYYRKQMFQQFIFEVNQIHTRITQSAYTNLIIMDRPYIEELFGTRQYPDGTFIMDYVDDIIQHEKVFMETEAEIREQVFHTFPVYTYALLFQNGKFVDEEFARWCNKNNTRWYDSNFYIGDSVTNLASCCFDGKQLCLTRSSLGGVKLLPFKDFCEASYKDVKRNLKIFHNGSWVKGDVVKLPKKQMYKIVTSNKKELYVTEDHVFPTDSGDKMVKDITTDDFLLFNTRRLDSFPEADKGLTYEQGFFIGMYLGDGSSQKREEFTPVINLSLNRQKYERTIDILSKAIGRIDEDVEVKLGKPYDNVYPVTIRSWLVYNFMREYVFGNYSYEKELNMDCLLQSYDFRRGILDGYYATDGGNSNRIYTTSEKLVPQVEALITSLGMNSVIDVSDRTDEPVIIRGEEYERHYPLHCIRWYSQTNKRNFGGVYKVVNNNEYFKIISIEKYDSDDDYVYCFNMKNEDEPYFTLPNGVISHNCRMLNDLSKQKQFQSSIGGSLIEIGSVKVSTINLMRIALESNKDKDRFISILTDRVKLNMEMLDCVRSIIKRNIEKGLLPNYSYGVINLEKQTTTNGLTAMFEAIREMGMTEKDKFGNVSYSQEGVEFASKIMDVVNELQDNAGFDYNVSLEIVPAESANVKLCRKDNVIYHRDKDFIYSNQWTNLMAKTTMKERVKLASILDKKAGGGQILHINLDGGKLTEEQSWEILNKIANSGVIYFAFNPKLSICDNKHTFFGETCPICGKKKSDEVTRIVGYLVPTSSYSQQRKHEEENRQWYTVGEDMYL